MPNAVNPVTIFVPMLVVIALTFFALFRMSGARADAIKGGYDPANYRTHQGPPEPEAVIVGVRHYGNLFELPTVFYAGCLTAFVLSAVSWWTLIFAWGYTLTRLAQSAVHLTYNNPFHRGMAFFPGVLFLMALWVALAISIIARM